MKYVTLLPFFGAVFAAGATGMFFQTGDLYRGLVKPDWTPPNWLFPVAWTLLYVAIAVAGWRVAQVPTQLA